MTSSVTPIRSAFVALKNEVESYLTLNEASIIYACYDTALSSISPEVGFDERFLYQSLGTSLDLARLGLRAEFLASALLYYPVSAGTIDRKRIEAQFGGTISSVIQKLLNIENLLEQYLPWQKKRKTSQQSKKAFWDERTKDQSPNFLLAVTKDIPEVAVIKVVDRLHLLRGIEQLVSEATFQQGLAEEALRVHAQVAERLGIWEIKWQLDDAAFKILQPEMYQAIKRDLNERRMEREEIVNRAVAILLKALATEGLKADVIGRPKHIYGLYLKMRQLGQSIKQVNDNLGLRIIVNTEPECYQALDILHRTWPPIEGIYGDKLFRDWIASPKLNGYQSIHTTVSYTNDENRLLEVQIRTYDMHDVAEYGIATHWIYRKAGNKIRAQLKYQKEAEDTAEIRRSIEKRRKRKK